MEFRENQGNISLVQKSGKVVEFCKKNAQKSGKGQGKLIFVSAIFLNETAKFNCGYFLRTPQGYFGVCDQGKTKSEKVATFKMNHVNTLFTACPEKMCCTYRKS